MSENPQPWTVHISYDAELPIYTVKNAGGGVVFAGTDKADANVISAAHPMLAALKLAEASMEAAGVRGGLDDVNAAIVLGTGAPF